MRRLSGRSSKSVCRALANSNFNLWLVLSLAMFRLLSRPSRSLYSSISSSSSLQPPAVAGAVTSVPRGGREGGERRISTSTTPARAAAVSDGSGGGGAGETPRVLITGGAGQLGRRLAKMMSSRYGNGNVILSDILRPPNIQQMEEPYIYADVTDMKDMHSIIVNNNIDTVVHFSAILSAVGEKDVQKALAVNITGLHNIMELCRAHSLKLFCPSTIGAFGPDAPKDCPDLTVQRPRTVYGVAKVHMELLGEYYNHRFGMDFRSLRFPGVISPDMPGGGTTDYAIHIFYDLLRSRRYQCFLRDDSRLPMIYIDDCLEATVKCLEVPEERFKSCNRTLNIQAVSFTPGELVEELKKHLTDFSVDYRPDERQAIADSWPDTLIDSRAREVLEWTPKYDLPKMVEIMLSKIKKIVDEENLTS